ncbi:MAG: class I SAM-dependent rRNA methyltransferase [Phycisphaerae bacterium]|nr:class I SAM-dependent rRNA methyltransferase [Phycisphaerae bacterium]
MTKSRRTPRAPRAPRVPSIAASGPHHAATHGSTPWVDLRSVAAGPFVYDRMIAGAAENAQPGDVVAVRDRTGAIVGHGLYNPRSRISVRMLRRGPEPIDDEFWTRALEAAVHLRTKTLRLDESTDAYRLVHAEGDGLSGLIVERYADRLVFELFSLGMFQRIDLIRDRLLTRLPPPTGPHAHGWRTIVRADDRVERLEGFRVADAMRGDDGGRIIIRENGVRFRVDPSAGHKTGFFCDQRDNRLRLAGYCRDADVLDVCCYTGAFGVYAKALGGAREVTCVDLDEQAVSLARENAHLNQARVQTVHADAYPYLRQMITNARQFDVVVLDPPKLIADRSELREGRQRYLDLNKMALAVVRRGGILLTCSCSGLFGEHDLIDVVRQAARIAGRSIAIFNLSGAAPDHPVAPECPESRYLNALWLRVL